MYFHNVLYLKKKNTHTQHRVIWQHPTPSARVVYRRHQPTTTNQHATWIYHVITTSFTISVANTTSLRSRYFLPSAAKRHSTCTHRNPIHRICVTTGRASRWTAASTPSWIASRITSNFLPYRWSAIVRSTMRPYVMFNFIVSHFPFTIYSR